MKKRLIKKFSAGVIAALLLTGIVAFAADYGTSEDPLVTLSYITSIFKPSMVTEINNKIETAKTELENKFNNQLNGSGGGANEFSVVSLSSGQTLIGNVGTELMLRIGSASCVASSSPGLIDTSSGSELNGGAALSTNHLYMVTVEGRGIRATSDVKIVIRGTYTIS